MVLPDGVPDCRGSAVLAGGGPSPFPVFIISTVDFFAFAWRQGGMWITDTGCMCSPLPKV
jgi:hypothetical protein